MTADRWLMEKHNSLKKALAMGIASSVLFSSTYIVNDSMSLAGCSWIWSASLRFLFMFVLLIVPVCLRKNMGKVLAEVGRNPWGWILWSTVGFGVFNAPLAFASMYGPSWLVAATFQFTIFAGALLSPLFYKDELRDGQTVRVRGKIPWRLFPAFGAILAGVFLLQAEHAESTSVGEAALFLIPVLISAFAYPLGNRKMMAICKDRLPTLERIFGMSLCSLPFWIILSGIGVGTAGWPPPTQVFQVFISAVLSGILATLLFFSATNMVKNSMSNLAIVESVQCGEVVFTMLFGVLLLGNALPGLTGWIGLALIVGGMIVNSLLSNRRKAAQ